jgi:hypothetical protein
LYQPRINLATDRATSKLLPSNSLQTAQQKKMGLEKPMIQKNRPAP